MENKNSPKNVLNPTVYIYIFKKKEMLLSVVC